MAIIAFNNIKPTISKTAKIFDGAHVIGDVTIDDDVGIWFNVTIRGDMAHITIGKRTNVQDHAVIHTSVDSPTVIGNDVTIGHQAIIHAATVEDGALIGMGSIILDGAVVHKNALVAAGTVVPPGKHVPENSLVMGNPMRVVKILDDATRDSIIQNKNHYVHLLKQYSQ